ncbi:MAG: SulP family inorganic anion transporter [Cellulomonadaceae bacterium]
MNAVVSLLRRRVLPRASDYAGLRTSWRRDLLAGLTVAVVALPLALGFGVTSGVGAAAGLVTAVVAGLVAAVFGGSNVQVSGPTGAMVVVLVPIVHRFGVGAVAAVAVLAGIVVIVAGLCGLGSLVAYIPWPVVEGFTLGIGVIIALQQVPLAVDTPKAPGENAALVAVGTLRNVDWSAAAPAVGIVVGVIATMLVLHRVRRSLPAALLAVVGATATAQLLHLPVDRIGELPRSLPAPSLPDLSDPGISMLFSAVLAVAALAALESLLSAQVADGMSDDAGTTNPNRELVGQGLANVASGFFGGLPATGAIARTAVNVRSGARTRLAAITHAIVLAGVVYLAAPIVATVPLSALAGVLIVTAARMVNLATARSILRSTRSDAIVFCVTAVMTVALDLIVAVEIGIAVAAVLALRHVALASRLTREPIDPEVDHATEEALLHERIAVFRIDGALFFADSRRFLDELVQVTDVRVVILRMRGVRVLDASGANALAALVADMNRRGVAVLVKGLPAEHHRVLDSVGVLAELRARHHVFDDLDAAVAHGRRHVRRDAQREPDAPAPALGP